MNKRKKLVIAAVIILLAALPIYALLPLFTTLDGEFRGAEYEYLILDGEKYALCTDHEPLIRGALLGTLPYGSEKALIFQAIPASGENESEYVYALIFKDGAYYRKIKQSPQR